ncbi:hypothetical protein ZOSMA_122G00420 [Zostera marina]|uniref:DUF7804 domain-containing protein n=1 Tax=Zostera marina TaxID=29655 RepID=A0A0K9Q0V1_ZOSMR|nr:hypothetical protein ZOSMA_122G00420 [Zostera marina]
MRADQPENHLPFLLPFRLSNHKIFPYRIRQEDRLAIGTAVSTMATAATAVEVFLDFGNRYAMMRNGDDVLCQNRSFKMSISTKKRKTMTPLMIALSSTYTLKKTADSSGGKLTTVNGLDDRRCKLPLISPETLDEWMMESVAEIMKNIKQAPFLIHVFSKEEKSSKASSSTLRLQTEPVPSRSWDSIKNRWTGPGCSVPDGIILVEELRDSEEETETKRVDHSQYFSQSQPQSRSSNTRTWGLLVQGRGAVHCSACYILNTCRVLSSVGASTHFNLIRASCFGETAETQLQNSWLQQR